MPREVSAFKIKEREFGVPLKPLLHQLANMERLSRIQTLPQYGYPRMLSSNCSAIGTTLSAPEDTTPRSTVPGLLSCLRKSGTVSPGKEESDRKGIQVQFEQEKAGKPPPLFLSREKHFNSNHPRIGKVEKRISKSSERSPRLCKDRDARGRYYRKK